jgi:hypothetical protein
VAAQNHGIASPDSAYLLAVHHSFTKASDPVMLFDSRTAAMRPPEKFRQKEEKCACHFIDHYAKI